MLKNITRLESIVNYPSKDQEENEVIISKSGHFYCDNDTPLQVAKEMILQFQKYIDGVEEEAKAKYDEKLKAQQEIVSLESPQEVTQ